MRRVIMHGAQDENGLIAVPFELKVLRICQRYNKLPSEVLNEPLEWLNLMDELDAIDNEKAEKQGFEDKIKKRLYQT